MKKIGVSMVLFLLLFTASALAEDFQFRTLPERSSVASDVEYVRGEILVKLKEGVSRAEQADLHSALGLAVLSEHRGGVERLRIPPGRTEHGMISLLGRDPRVEYAELNTKCYAFMVPDDPSYDPGVFSR